jgi:hypothetical protein
MWGEVRRVVEKAVNASTALLCSPCSCGLFVYCALKLRSHTATSARPCATLARRATVHGVLASKSLSSVSTPSGWRYPARTYGSAELASVDSERRRKVWKEGSWDAEGGEGRWCAR